MKMNFKNHITISSIALMLGVLNTSTATASIPDKATFNKIVAACTHSKDRAASRSAQANSIYSAGNAIYFIYGSYDCDNPLG